MLTLVAAALALAADPAPPVPAADAIENCRTVEGDAARLACYDRAAADFSTARAKKDLVVMDRASVRRTKRSLFGFSLPSFNIFGSDDDDADAVKELNAKIQSAAPFGYGYYTLTLDDGTEWQTTDRSPAFTPRRGDAIKIKHGAFGYRASSLGGMVAVRRVK